MPIDTIKKVAFIHGDFPFGGAEKVTLDIADYLSPEGYKIYVFATDFRPELMPAGKDYPIEVIRLPDRNIVKSRKDAEFIHRQIIEHDVKIIVLVAKRLKYIDIIRSTGAKIVYAHHNMPFHEAQAYIDRAWAKGMRSPLRFVEWMLISYPKYVLLGGAKKREARFYKGSYDECDRYVMLCDEYKDAIIDRLGLNPDDNKLRVIENYQTIPDNINFSKENIILYTGRLSYADKRLDRLIDAWAMIYKKLPEWKVIIVGDGKERKNIDKRIRKKKCERIVIEGYTNNIQQYYDKGSILALVSTYEGWPLSLTEAMSNGLIPVIFGSFAAAKHIIGTDGQYGISVKPFDIEKFADALYEIAVMPEDKKNAMRKAIVAKVRNDFSVEKCGRKWMDMFDELLLDA